MAEKYNGGKHIWIGILIAVLLIAIFALIYIRKVSAMEQDYAAMNSSHQTQIQDLNQQIDDLNQQIYDSSHPKNGITEHGHLHVKGADILDESGEKVVLRGVSSHGLAWYPEFCNYRAMQQLKDRGANVFRIAMYVEGYNCYLTQKELNTKLLYQAIENALAADLYAIVDWHVLKDENPLFNAESAVEFFETVAGTYGDNPGIIYEICNEPNGQTSFEDIRQYADIVIPVIRKYAPHAVILVGTPNFSSSLDEAAAQPLNYDNICFTYHYYAQHMGLEDALAQMQYSIDCSLPVIVSEWGYPGERLEGDSWTQTKAFLDFLDKNGISWINWSLCNKDESYSIVRPDTLQPSGWSENQLSQIGNYVLGRLKSGDS